MSRFRKLVVTAAAVGTLGALVGTGTFASFSASTTNKDNVFATGTIELSNTKQDGVACVSGYTGTGTANPQTNLDGNGNDQCDALIDMPLARPGATSIGNVALANSGEYDGLLQVWLDGCASAVADATAPAGSGNLCDKVEVYIQETNSAYTNAVSSCVFPFSANAACDDEWAATGDSIAALATAATPAAPAPSTAITLDEGAVRYYQVALRFPDGEFDVDGNGADNAFQNRHASFDLTWRLREAPVE